jgi:hypothetical protein
VRNIAREKADNVNEFTLDFAGACFPRCPTMTPRAKMTCDYDGFNIESFEAGRGLWHARIRRADLMPVFIDGVSFSTLEIGFAWSGPDAAIADAIAQIEQLNLKQYPTEAQEPQTELPMAS